MRTAMEWIARFWGSLRRRRSDRDLEHELYSHLELTRDADRARGRTPADADHSTRLSGGGVSQAMDALRDQRGLPWFDALRSDVIFAWRHLNRTRRTTVAAVLSLALAIGATMGAFRLVDPVLWRSLPVSNPTSLFAVTTRALGSDNRWETRRLFAY